MRACSCWGLARSTLLGGDLRQCPLPQVGETADLLVTRGQALLQPGDLFFEALDLSGARVRDHARFAKLGQPALELLRQVLVGAWPR
jgi:hypothetical protein